MTNSKICAARNGGLKTINRGKYVLTRRVPYESNTIHTIFVQYNVAWNITALKENSRGVLYSGCVSSSTSGLISHGNLLRLVLSIVLAKIWHALLYYVFPFRVVAKFWNRLMHALMTRILTEEGNGERNARSELMGFRNPLDFSYFISVSWSREFAREEDDRDISESFFSIEENSDLFLASLLNIWKYSSSSYQCHWSRMELLMEYYWWNYLV